jgi:hypothetical protein
MANFGKLAGCFFLLAFAHLRGTWPKVVLPASAEWELASGEFEGSLRWVLLGPSSGLFRPVLTCAVEPFGGSLEDYVASARRAVEKEPSAHWLPLAQGQSPAGPWILARVSQTIGRAEPYLQAFIVHEGWAAVITGVFSESTWLEEANELEGLMRKCRLEQS